MRALTLAKTIDIGPFHVELHQDQEGWASNPRDCFNVGRFCGLNGWTFNDSPARSVGDAYREARTGGPIIAIPVAILDGPYTIVQETDDWTYADGIYWAGTAETDAIADHGIRDLPTLKAALRREIATLNQWLEGDIWGYVVTGPDGEPLSSCWGYVGEEDYCLSEGIAAAEHILATTPEWVLLAMAAHAESDDN